MTVIDPKIITPANDYQTSVARMVPTLFPRLWPTIAVNAAVP